MKGIRIDYFLPELKLGGSEKHVIQLASGLRQRGHDARIVSLFREGPLAGEAREMGIPFTCLNLSYHWGVETFRGIWDWIHSHPTDILHTYLFGFHLFAGLPARMSKIPVTLSSRRDVDLVQKRRHLWLENLGNLFVDHVICCSRAVEVWVLDRERIRSEKVSTIYNGVDLGFFKGSADGLRIRREFGIPKHAPVVGTVANFSPKKAYADLLEGIELILEKNPAVWFLLVGRGPLECEIKEKAQSLPRSQQVIFTGSRSDIPDLMSAMDLFVFVSLWEGLPNVLLEAMAMGRPVISTAVGGVPELIEEGKEGILIPPRNLQTFSRAVFELLGDYKRAQAMGLQAQEKIRREFGMERMVSEYENLYLSLLSKSGEASETLPASISS